MQPIQNIRSKRNFRHRFATGVDFLSIRPLKLFRSRDYLAFVCGVYLLGSLIGVPMILLSLVHSGYGDTLIWSLIACTVFVIVFRTNGTVSLLRVGIVVMLVGIVVSLYTRHPMFNNIFLSSVMALLVLLVCGISATTISRARRGRMNGSGLAVLGIAIALFMWFVFGQLNGLVAFALSLLQGSP